MWLLIFAFTVFLRLSIVENVELTEPAEPASCMPVLQLVKFKENSKYVNNDSVIILPHCTRVKRCSGCCDSEFQTCKPTKEKIHKYKVILSFFVKDTGGALSDSIEIAEHTECKCVCKNPPGKCAKDQRYDESKCRCVPLTLLEDVFHLIKDILKIKPIRIEMRNRSRIYHTSEDPFSIGELIKKFDISKKFKFLY